MTIPVLLIHELFVLGKDLIPRVITLKLCVVYSRNFNIHLSKYDKLKFIVSSFYYIPFKSYGPDYIPIKDIEYQFWTRGQFANQTAILDLHAV